MLDKVSGLPSIAVRRTPRVNRQPMLHLTGTLCAVEHVATPRLDSLVVPTTRGRGSGDRSMMFSSGNRRVQEVVNTISTANRARATQRAGANSRSVRASVKRYPVSACEADDAKKIASMWRRNNGPPRIQ